jgi:hypothetical protein
MRIYPVPLHEDNSSEWKCQEVEKEKHIDIHFSPLISSSLRHSSIYCPTLSFTLLHCHLANPATPTTTPFTFPTLHASTHFQRLSLRRRHISAR